MKQRFGQVENQHLIESVKTNATIFKASAFISVIRGKTF
jgi:hypothetical protein